MSPFTKTFFIAQTFLTRIPTPKIEVMSEEEISYSVLYYPVIGLCIGLFLAVVSLLLSMTVTADGYPVIAAFVVAMWVLITGALHLDGLADTADGFLGGYGSTEKTLKIMKDPVSGPAGIAAIFLVLLIKYTAILSLLKADVIFLGILLAPMIARTVAVGLLTYTPSAQQSGLVYELKKTEFPEYVATLLLFISILVLIATGFYTLLVLGVLVYIIRYWAIVRLNGISGDILGLSIELTEALFLLMAVIIFI